MRAHDPYVGARLRPLADWSVTHAPMADAAPRGTAMIELRTLGALELRGTDGGEFRRVLQQPKRLALLAYLAVATPRRFHRRDTLLGLFWPELDAEHARAALRRSLYFLRGILGDDVLVGRGDEEIGLGAGTLWCDTRAFEESLTTGDLAGALALYRGALLQGFYVSDAPDFERWLEVERASLLDRAASAAWTLAERSMAAGAAGEGARWGRRAAALTPHDEVAHRRLACLLAEAGDRAGALRAFEEFAHRLRTDYDMAPSVESRALLARIRAQRDVGAAGTSDATVSSSAASPSSVHEPLRASVGPSLPEPHHAYPTSEVQPAPTGPLSSTVVAVLPFVVRGSREFAYLGEGVVDLLSTMLDSAGELRTVDPRALLSHLARDAARARALDPTTASVVARHFGAGLFVLGTVVEAGGRLRLTASLYDGSTGAVRASAEAMGASEAAIFDMLDELARQLLAQQGEGPGARLAKLAARTTHSLPALRAYLRGECEFRAGRFFQALEEFRNAVAEDAGFALAHFRLSAAAAATANVALARDASAQAVLHRERLGEHDRLLVDAQSEWLRGAADEAERLYMVVLATHLDDMEAWFGLGDVLYHYNPLRGRSMVESRKPFERALSFEPDHVSSLVHLARLSAFEGDGATLDALVERVLRLSPAGDRALSMRALRAFSLGDEIEKARTVTALARARALTVGIAFTDIALYARDVRGADRLARIFAKLVRAPEERTLCLLVLAHLSLARGRCARAAAALDAAARLDEGWSLEVKALLALLPFRCPADDELASLRDRLERWDADSAPANRNQVLAVHNGAHAGIRLYLMGLVHARLGETAEALRCAGMLERTADPAGAAGFYAYAAATIRAAAAARNDDWAAALRLLERTRPAMWYQLSVTSPVYAGAYERFQRAELLARFGRIEEALAWYRTLGQSSPYELPFVAPSHLRRAQLLERRGDTAAAARHAARAVALWDGCDAELRPLLEDAVRLAGSRG